MSDHILENPKFKEAVANTSQWLKQERISLSVETVEELLFGLIYNGKLELPKG